MFLDGYYKAWSVGSGPCDLCKECNLSGSCNHGLEAGPLDFQICSGAYVNPFLRQTGGDGFYQGGENRIPQLFNVSLWIM